VNFPFISSNILALSAYEEHIPQLIPYGSSDDFIDRSHHFKSFTITTMTWLTVTEYQVLQMTTYMICLSYSHSCTILMHTAV